MNITNTKRINQVKATEETKFRSGKPEKKKGFKACFVHSNGRCLSNREGERVPQLWGADRINLLSSGPGTSQRLHKEGGNDEAV